MLTFWILGPAGLNRVFDVKHSDDVIHLVEIDSNVLDWRGAAHA